ncbi:hypothetical protein [Sporosarcina sp. P13]|uniref:hypothetical protein n=1 Tax=Sporosarcina sp. P13 TaxID=2048263 RepID=UPI0013043518|nr:hypothetical protein [Sporosarcina sp. P13]
MELNWQEENEGIHHQAKKQVWRIIARVVQTVQDIVALVAPVPQADLAAPVAPVPQADLAAPVAPALLADLAIMVKVKVKVKAKGRAKKTEMKLAE